MNNISIPLKTELRLGAVTIRGVSIQRQFSNDSKMSGNWLFFIIPKSQKHNRNTWKEKSHAYRPDGLKGRTVSEDGGS